MILLNRVRSTAKFLVLALFLNCHTFTFALEVNAANVAELDSIKGMGPALSAKLLKAREQALFQNWQDMMQRVSGMGPLKAQQFSAQGLTVQGQSFKD